MKSNGNEEAQGYWIPGQIWEIKPEKGTRLPKIIMRNKGEEPEIVIYSDSMEEDKTIMKTIKEVRWWSKL
jgi:Cft2 family RNA processing exonuclease